MSALDDLKAIDAQLSQSVAALGQAVTDEIARVEKAISALSGDNPDVIQVVADLKAVNTNLANAVGQLNAERPDQAASPAAGAKTS